jgi:hypothetical protein
MTRIVESHPLLTKVYNKLACRVQEQINKRPNGRRGQSMDVPCVGFFEVKFDDVGPKAKGIAVSLHFQGTGKLPRSRRYAVRKDGTLNFDKINKIVEERFDKQMTFYAEYDAKSKKATKEFDEARRLGPIVFEQVRSGPAYLKEDVAHHAGGFDLVHRSSGLRGQVWSQSEDTCSGQIPFSDLPVAKLNEILKILGKA